MFSTCLLPTQYLLLFVPSHKKRGKKTTGFSPFLLYQWLQSTQECTFSLNNFYAQLFLIRQFYGHQVRQSNRHKFTKVVTLHLVSIGDHLGLKCNGQRSMKDNNLCKLDMAGHDKNIIYYAKMCEREKLKKKRKKHRRK